MNASGESCGDRTDVPSGPARPSPAQPGAGGPVPSTPAHPRPAHLVPSGREARPTSGPVGIPRARFRALLFRTRPTPVTGSTPVTRSTPVAAAAGKASGTGGRPRPPGGGRHRGPGGVLHVALRGGTAGSGGVHGVHRVRGVRGVRDGGVRHHAEYTRRARWPGSGSGATVIAPRRTGPRPASPDARAPPRRAPTCWTTARSRTTNLSVRLGRAGADLPWRLLRGGGAIRGGGDGRATVGVAEAAGVCERERGEERAAAAAPLRPPTGPTWPEVENRTLKPNVETRKARRASVPST